MYQNPYHPVATLMDAPVKTGGICSVRYIKQEDVLAWPEIDPSTGIMTSSITVRPGAYIYLCESISDTRAFDEQQKSSTGGEYFDITVKAGLRGSDAAQILTLQRMKHHQFVLIVTDRNGVTRLIGNEDSGADLFMNYTAGDPQSSRKTELAWKWQHPTTAPVYTAEAFDIVIGGITITAGAIQLIMRFRVGDAGAPMAEGDTVLISSGFTNKYCLVLASGIALPVDDGLGTIDWTGSVERHIEKTLASNTITFIGGVVTGEIIEVYAFS